MPQMAPLNWLSLMIMFTTILIVFNTMNYFTFNQSVKTKKSNLMMKKINWKW